MKKFLLLFIIGTVILLSLVQTILSNTLSTSGTLMNKINKEIQAYKTENSKLSEKLFAATALTNIAIKAAKAGFSQSKNQFLVNKSLPLAVRQ